MALWNWNFEVPVRGNMLEIALMGRVIQCNIPHKSWEICLFVLEIITSSFQPWLFTVLLFIIWRMLKNGAWYPTNGRKDNGIGQLLGLLKTCSKPWIIPSVKLKICCSPHIKCILKIYFWEEQIDSQCFMRVVCWGFFKNLTTKPIWTQFLWFWCTSGYLINVVRR